MEVMFAEEITAVINSYEIPVNVTFSGKRFTPSEISFPSYRQEMKEEVVSYKERPL